MDVSSLTIYSLLDGSTHRLKVVLCLIIILPSDDISLQNAYDNGSLTVHLEI